MKTEKIGPPSLSKFVFYVTANLPGRLRDIQQNVKISIFVILEGTKPQKSSQ